MLADVFLHDSYVTISVPAWAWLTPAGLVLAAVVVAAIVGILTSRSRRESD